MDLDDIFVEVDQGLAHLARMLLVYTKHDCLRESIGLRQEFGQVLCDCFSTCAQGDDPFEVLRAVLTIGNLLAVAIHFTLTRAVSDGVIVGHYAMNSIRGQKAVFNALL